MPPLKPTAAGISCCVEGEKHKLPLTLHFPASLLLNGISLHFWFVAPRLIMATLVVDNGAGMLKAGLVPKQLDTASAELPVEPVCLPNCTAKSRAEKKFFVADGLDTAVELSALYIRRPHDRGYVVNWDLEGDVWQRMCHADVLGVKPAETSVLVTEPLFCPSEIKDNMAEFIFEEMGFQRFCSAPAPLLAYADHRCWDPESVLSRTGCGIVVDSGFSFTHTVPIYEGRIVYKACRRIDIGGKALTNLLKETISNRQFNMMDETVLVNGIKERLCFVSTSLDQDLRTCKKRGGANSIRRLYCLPTGLPGQDRLGHVVEPGQERGSSLPSTNAVGGGSTPAASPSKRVKIDSKDTGSHAAADKGASASGEAVSAAGRVWGEDDAEEAYLEVGNERFTVPEVLFAPHMVGMRQCGIHHTIASSISLLDPDLHSLLYSTIVAYGGNTRMPGCSNPARALAS